MPVIPNGVTPYKIQPPCTIGDDGAPSDSLAKDTDRVFALIEDERHLTAGNLLTSVQRRIAERESLLLSQISSSKTTKKGIFNNKKEKEVAEVREKKAAEIQQLKDFLQSKHAVLTKLENRCRLFRKAQQNLNATEDWTLASKHFGITTYYRREEDESLSIKLEGEVKDAPLFEQICVLKEVDLHYKWSPFCTSSLTIADLDKLDMVGWFIIGLANFGLARDGCCRIIGCDNIQEDGSVLLTGQGVQDIMPNKPLPTDTYLSGDPIIEKLEIPPVPTRLGSGRMTIRKFEAKIHITSPTSALTRVVANVDPNIAFLPTSLIEFVMKHLAGVMLAKLQGAAKKAAQHPASNVHAVKMREEREFYQKWLMAKFQGICESKGWEVPRVAAFHLSEQDLQKANRLKSHGPSRAQTFSGESPEEHMVENLSAVSSSARYRAGTADNMSELSNETGKNSVWTNNPIAVFLRETELKVKRRKEEEVAAVRRRAAERLQPKELPSDKQERLAELKKAKARRLGACATDQPRTLDESHESFGLWQRFAGQLYSHEPRTRIVVVVSLVFILFTMLHPEPLLKYLPVEFEAQAPWRELVFHDIGVVMYILLCAIPHFLLCDVALVYAFDALELGSKTGRQVKKYYSDNVRLGVAVGSLGIVGASVLKAALKVWARCLLWCAFQLYGFVQKEVFSRAWSLLIDSLQIVPEEVRNTCTALFYTVSVSTKNVIAMALRVLGVPVKLAWHFFFESNFVGRDIARVVGACIGACIGVARRANYFIEESIGAFEGKISIVAWRMEAFHVARSLFLYTAVFLLTALLLFHFSARKSRPAPSTIFDSATKATQPDAVEHMKSDTSSMSGESGSYGPAQAPASGTQRYSAIPEDNAVSEENDVLRKPFTPDSESTGSARRRRFRFRSRKSSSSPLVATTGPINVTSETSADLEHLKILEKAKSF